MRKTLVRTSLMCFLLAGTVIPPGARRAHGEEILDAKYGYVTARMPGYSTIENESWEDGLDLHETGTCAREYMGLWIESSMRARAIVSGGGSPAAWAYASENADYYGNISVGDVVARAVHFYSFGAEPDPGPRPPGLPDEADVPVTLSFEIKLFCSPNWICRATGRIDVRERGVSGTIFVEEQDLFGELEIRREGSPSFTVREGKTYMGDLIADAFSLGPLPHVPYEELSGGGMAYALVDPVITIDPTYEFADYFHIVQYSLSEIPIPEPSSLALSGAGALGLVAFGCRRRKPAQP